MIRFRTGDIVTRLEGDCPCGRTFARFVVQGRLDDMFTVSGVNVFPSDIESVARTVPGLSGEYRINVFTEDHMTRFDIEVEELVAESNRRELAENVSRLVKTRLGVRPKEVRVLPRDTLPRATHKAKRLVDKR
jgi:phenylacetate-CoA ligase